MALNLGAGGGQDGIGIRGNMHASSRDYEIISDTALIFPTAAPEAGADTFARLPNREEMLLGNGFVVGRVSRSGDGQASNFGSQSRCRGSAQFFVVAGTEPRDRLIGRLQFPADAGTEVSRVGGLFSGMFRNPAEVGRVRSFGGVFLQHQNSGRGLFPVAGRTGTVTITPRQPAAGKSPAGTLAGPVV